MGCRKVVLDLLTQALAGDAVAAEYTLLHLLSSVLVTDTVCVCVCNLWQTRYGRLEVMALGKYSLNLSGCPGGTMVQSLHQLLQNLLTKVSDTHYSSSSRTQVLLLQCFPLPLTLANMNSWRFTPKKDYESNRLLAAVLQLSPGEHLWENSLGCFSVHLVRNSRPG